MGNASVNGRGKGTRDALANGRSGTIKAESSRVEGNDRLTRMGELAWLFAVILCALGVCLTAKSGFGVSMVVAPAYVLHLKLVDALPFFTFGMAEYCLQGLVILILIIVMRRFRYKYLLSFVTAIVYGLALDAWRLLFGPEICTEFSQRLLACAVGIPITAFSIALFLRTYLPQEGYELFVKGLAEGKGYSINKVKWAYDAVSLLTAIVLMLCLFGQFSFEMVGVGTLIMTLINAPLIAFFGKLLDQRIDFSPAFSGFYEWYMKTFDGRNA